MRPALCLGAFFCLNCVRKQQVQPDGRVAEIQAGQLFDALHPVEQRIAVDEQTLGRLYITAFALQIDLQRAAEFGVVFPVVVLQLRQSGMAEPAAGVLLQLGQAVAQGCVFKAAKRGGIGRGSGRGGAGAGGG